MSVERCTELYDRIDQGLADDAERAELTALIQADSGCRRWLVETALRDAQLRKIFAATQAAPGAQPAANITSGAASPFRRWAWAAAAAVFMLALGCLLWVWQNQSPPSPTVQRPPDLPNRPDQPLPIPAPPVFTVAAGQVTVNGESDRPIALDAVIQTPTDRAADLRGPQLQLHAGPGTTWIVRQVAAGNLPGRVELLAGELDLTAAAGADWQVVSPLGGVHPAAGATGAVQWRLSLIGPVPTAAPAGSAGDHRQAQVRVFSGEVELTPPAATGQGSLAAGAIREPVRLKTGEIRKFGPRRHQGHADHEDDADDDDDDDDDDGPAAGPDRPRAEELAPPRETEF